MRRHVEKMMFDFMPDNEEIPMRAVARSTNWEDVDASAARLTALRAVTIGVASLDDLAVFAQDVIPRLPFLRRVNKLRFAVWNGKPKLGWKWIACDLDSTREGT